MTAPLLDTTSAAPLAEADAAQPAGAGVALSAVETEPGWRAASQRCAAVAAQFADSVDREARFPHEAFDALKRERLLSAMVPAEFGGTGLSLADVGAICETLAHGCASTAMVYAMHQIQVACIEAHGSESAWHRQLLAQLVEHQWLLASATSEETIGGNMRTSACSVELDGEPGQQRFRIEKLAPTISYGAHADGILVTARRTAESAAADQVLIVALREETQLEKRGGWDAMGMRGTCSEGFRLVATGLAEQILPAPFADIADQTMLPVSHTLWASVWTGVASDAVNRAKAFFRAQARSKPGAIPPGGLRLAEAVGLLQMMQARLSVALEAARTAHHARHGGSQADAPLAAMLGFASDMNTLKTSISTTALQVVQEVLMICGMAGYKNGTEYSVGRHLRDLYSAPLMINNDRIAQNTASLLLAQRPAAPGRA
ncbi:Cyclohex-1-ene-1-carbonyl-CoA dehydrogenase [Paraburkholderia domus]|jgi:Acyl-CoA dehydrogenases|uniref:acyl-CoA dehydrogenase family protein n=1 Tax=Paraburkholderia domus TaxID=2793075 RepID=UPI0019141C46|nr:acyl-CoA dehydrogenase family protein [Paraburkholderia domus]MBK5050428.1 acyl-CoA/acyl-ACP dehydrogenase [Burkholderia sp. R-70006]MBK5062220.1 acyl-CoA/acyl-ACP dehydrogenase [Burkholderia sp. R-70199]MBK5088040.1 acyl-CoA/acyl-ACP dehydrogenase [Burkholderia sp. R-69927]MBK5181586.1 acyl-CoA/acyl-ACP dehydrogenase [Burkholderia sp. R-69749]MCI0146815.1 acyl-CoA dehydrogenase family protein [Paraburkholderia sediminicola]